MNQVCGGKILKYRKRGRGYQFLKLTKEVPTHDIEWQPSRDFIDTDGTINEEFLNYVQKNIFRNDVVEVHKSEEVRKV